MSIIQGSSISASSTESGEFYDFPINQSLRFDGSSYLERTFSGLSTTERQIRTISFWCKRSDYAAGDDGGRCIGSRYYAGSTNYSSGGIIFLRTNDKIQLTDRDSSSGTSDIVIETNAVYRDLSAWYHFVFQIDTT